MATSMERAIILTALAVTACFPVQVRAGECQQVVASLAGTTADRALARAAEIIAASNAAQQKQARRGSYAPSFDLKLVRSRRNPKHTYILGGGAALPM